MVWTWAKTLWQNKFLRGSAVFALVSFGVSVLNYGSNFLIARFFPLASYGEYITALAYMGILTVPLGMLNILLVKKIGGVATSQRKNFTKNLEINLIYLVKRKWTLIVIALGLLAGGLVYQSNLSYWSIFWIIAMTGIALVTAFYTAALQAYKHFWQAGSINIYSATIKLIAILVVIKYFLNIQSLYLVVLFSVLIAMLWSRKIAVGSVQSPRLTPSIHVIGLINLLSKDYWLPFLATLGMVGMLSVDMMIVKNLFSSDGAGLYAGLALMGKIILFVTAPLSTVAFTFFTGHESRNSSFKILLLNVFLIIGAGLVLLTAYIIYPEFILKFVLGPKFISLAPVIYLAAGFGILYSLNNLFSQYALAKNSLISLVSLIFTVMQAILLLNFHRDYTQIMMINLGIALMVLMSFVTWLIVDNLRHKSHQQPTFA